ncbi:MAG: glycosyltransferase family 2 protein [Candidatus Moranbacteria bacterium]|nr:glycosyltransferase family 2 protein [Candidatus Moranbacteria bacterium]
MISVITPCYNIIKDGREEYFHKMMKSVHEQTYKDIEHIFIDGGSNDGTLEILKKYQDKGWIDKLISEKDTGIYEALNKGIGLARGEFINIMNTDDYFTDKNFFSRSIVEIEKHDVDFTHADKIIKSRKWERDAIKRGDERVAFFRMPFRHQTMIVRKNVFDELGLFDEKYKIASDYKFVLQMLLANKRGHYLPEIHVCSLDGGISSNRQKCIEEVSQVLFECYGKKYHLTAMDCNRIYIRKIPLLLLLKIILLVKNNKIRNSLVYNYLQSLNFI